MDNDLAISSPADEESSSDSSSFAQTSPPCAQVASTDASASSTLTFSKTQREFRRQFRSRNRSNRLTSASVAPPFFSPFTASNLRSLSMTSKRISNALSSAPSGFRHVAEQYTMSAQQLSHFFLHVMTRPQFRQILFAVLTEAEADARAEDMSDLLLAAECKKLYMHDEADEIEFPIESRISAEISYSSISRNSPVNGTRSFFPRPIQHVDVIRRTTFEKERIVVLDKNHSKRR